MEAALKGGLTLLQYREKTADDVCAFRTSYTTTAAMSHYGALFIINDRVDLALAVDADGVHLGQQDMPIAVARQLLGSQRLIGRSTTNPEEMQGAIAEGADYIGVGPVYETPTKVGKAAAGLEYVSYAAQNCQIPWFAIGGIDMNNMNDVMNAGAQRVAVVRSLIASRSTYSSNTVFSLATAIALNQNRINVKLKIVFCNFVTGKRGAEQMTSGMGISQCAALAA